MVSPPSNKHKKKNLVEESLKMKKAREKLKKRFASIDQKMTKEALSKKSVEIHRWISRNANKRITLRDKSIALFDENQNAAEISERISKIVEKIQEEGISDNF